MIRLRFVCALVRLTDSIAPDHYKMSISMTEGRKLEQSRSRAYLVIWSKRRTSFAPVCGRPSSRTAPRTREVDLKGSERGANGRLPGEERRRRPRPMPVRCTEPSGGTGGGWWTASWRCESLMRICPSRWSELPTRSRVPSSLESMCSAEASLPVVLIPCPAAAHFRL